MPKKKDDTIINATVDGRVVTIDVASLTGAERRAVRRAIRDHLCDDITPTEADIDPADEIYAYLWVVMLRDDPTVQFEHLYSTVPLGAFMDDAPDTRPDDAPES